MISGNPRISHCHPATATPQSRATAPLEMTVQSTGESSSPTLSKKHKKKKASTRHRVRPKNQPRSSQNLRIIRIFGAHDDQRKPAHLPLPPSHCHTATPRHRTPRNDRPEHRRPEHEQRRKRKLARCRGLRKHGAPGLRGSQGRGVHGAGDKRREIPEKHRGGAFWRDLSAEIGSRYGN
jgi:hypothetical protein